MLKFRPGILVYLIAWPLVMVGLFAEGWALLRGGDETLKGTLLLGVAVLFLVWGVVEVFRTPWVIGPRTKWLISKLPVGAFVCAGPLKRMAGRRLLVDYRAQRDDRKDSFRIVREKMLAICLYGCDQMTGEAVPLKTEHDRLRSGTASFDLPKSATDPVFLLFRAGTVDPVRLRVRMSAAHALFGRFRSSEGVCFPSALCLCRNEAEWRAFAERIRGKNNCGDATSPGKPAT